MTSIPELLTEIPQVKLLRTRIAANDQWRCIDFAGGSYALLIAVDGIGLDEATGRRLRYTNGSMIINLVANNLIAVLVLILAASNKIP